VDQNGLSNLFGGIIEVCGFCYEVYIGKNYIDIKNLKVNLKVLIDKKQELISLLFPPACHILN
jgi:hypothetical protein